MKKYVMFLTGLSLLFIFSDLVQAGVTVSPSSITIPRDKSSTRTITYILSDPIGASPPVPSSSSQGIFMSGGKTLGTVNKTLTGMVDSTPATTNVLENLTIPQNVIKKAEALGVNSFQYKRRFSSLLGNTQAVVNIKLSGSLRQPSPAFQLRITRIQLYFKNKRAQITVKKREKGLQAFADIRYEGKGLFQGFWQVDGRLISRVNKHLLYGDRLTIKSPRIPELPTFIEGSHEVKFIITNPSQSFTPPRAVYYVRPQETEKAFAIDLAVPLNNDVVDIGSAIFRWRDRRGLSAYLVQFTEDNDANTVFSAYTRKPEYMIPPYVLKHYFKTGKTYSWQVKGFDSRNNMVGESDHREFVFRP